MFNNKGMMQNTTFKQGIQNRHNYDLFGEVNKEILHWGKLYMHLFMRPYSVCFITQKFKQSELIDRVKREYKVSRNNMIRFEYSDMMDITHRDPDRGEVFIILKDEFCVIISKYHIYLMYGSNVLERERNRFLKLANEYLDEEKDFKRKFYMLQQRFGGLDLGMFDVSPFEVEIESHYNDDFKEVDKIISGAMESKGKNGLVLLHGKAGTGKTTYIRHLINQANREFIYLPVEMISDISAPNLIPIISLHRNSVLILEDCDQLLSSRENNQHSISALSNLLNLGDGLLADALSTNVICTFNSGLKKIDEAILRKGRLIARYEFNELNAQKATRLARKLGYKKFTAEKPMTLSEIYNLDSDDESHKQIAKKRIGFR